MNVIQNISTPRQILFNILIFVVLLLVLWGHYFGGKRLSNWAFTFSVFLILIFCLFPFWGNDYWHYLIDYYELKKGGKTNMEEVYSFIVQKSPTYFSFRAIVWGMALFCMLCGFRVMKIDKGICLFLFVCLFLPLYSYARVSLVMSMIFLGLALFTKKRFWPVIFGTLLIGLSYYFHKSAVYGIAMSLLSIFLEKRTKLAISIIILLIPVFLFLIQNQLIDIMSLDADEEENQALYTSQLYLGTNVVTQGLSAIIRTVIQRTSLLLVLILYIRMAYNSELINLPISIRIMAGFAALCIVSSFLLLLSGEQLNVTSISYRLSLYAWIPAIAFLSYCKTNYIHSKALLWIFIFGLSNTSYMLLYSLYNLY